MGQRRLGRDRRCAPAPWEGCRHGLYEEKVGASEEGSFGRMYCDGCFAFDWSIVLRDYLSGVVRYPPIERHNPTRLLDNFRARLMEIPFAW